MSNVVSDPVGSVIKAGNAVLGALGVQPVKPSTYADLPSSTDGDINDVPEEDEEEDEEPPVSTYADIPTSNNDTPDEDPVTEPVFTAAEEEALRLAKAAGLDINSPAVEGVVLMTLEKYGDPAKAVAALDSIDGDVNAIIRNQIVFGGTSCGTACDAADEIRALTGLDSDEYRKELTDQMEEIDTKRNPTESPATYSQGSYAYYGQSSYYTQGSYSYGYSQGSYAYYSQSSYNTQGTNPYSYSQGSYAYSTPPANTEPQESSSCFLCVERFIDMIGEQNIRNFINTLPDNETALEAIDRYTAENCADITCTRGIRNNNPGNIEEGDPWIGIIPGEDGRFVTFSTPEYGIRAMFKLQLTYENKYGLETVRERIARWAPEFENDTEAYIQAVAKSMGIDPDDSFSIEDPILGPAFTNAVINHENGSNPYSGQQIAEGYKLAFNKELDGTTVVTTNTGGSNTKDYFNNLLDSYTKDDDVPIVTIGTNTSEELSAEERTKLMYMDYAAGRTVARDALAAAAGVTKETIETNCGTNCSVEVVSRGVAAGVEEFQVIIKPSATGLSAEDQSKLAIAAELGLNVSDPTKAAAALLLGTDLSTEEYKKRLESINGAGTDGDVLNRLVDDIVTGQNTVEGNFLATTLGGVPGGEGGLTKKLRAEIDAANQDGADILEVLEAAKQEYLQSQTGGEPVVFSELTPQQQEAYLGITQEKLRTAQTAVMETEYNKYVPISYSVADSSQTAPAVTTTQGDSCGFVCSVILSPFGGEDNARELLTRMIQAQKDAGATEVVDATAQISDQEARERLAAAGITVVESRPGATDLEGVREGTLQEILDLKEACGCDLVITGGTEEGVHADGTFSHENGFKIDVRTIDRDTGAQTDIAKYVIANFEVDRTRNDGAIVYIDPAKPNVEYAMEGDHLDISVISEEGAVITTNTGNNPVVTVLEKGLEIFDDYFSDEPAVSDDNTQTDTTPEPAKPATVVEQVVDATKDLFDSIFDFFTPSTGTNNTPDTTDSDDDDSDNDTEEENDPDTEQPMVTTDLRVKATVPTKSGIGEYRFKGELTRSVNNADAVPYAELQKNFSAIMENRLNIDYSCDGSIDLQKKFTLPYRLFSANGETSTILISEYVSATQYGSHCFTIDVDTTNVIQEANESNNTSNSYAFTIARD